jgi:hypothetical protein
MEGSTLIFTDMSTSVISVMLNNLIVYRIVSIGLKINKFPLL